MLPTTPATLLREAVRQVPSLRYAIGVGGVAAVVSIVLTAWKLPPQAAIVGGLIVLVAMVVLVVFANLSRTGPQVLRPLSLFLGWAFLLITVSTAVLFVSCAFFDRPKKLACLFSPCGDDDDPSQRSSFSKEVARAKLVLADLYGGRFQNVYDLLTANIQGGMSFVNFKNVSMRTLAQVSGGPLHRKLTMPPQAQAGTLVVAFESEFDEKSTWFENIGYVRTPRGWELAAISFAPISWSAATGTSKILAETDPSQVLEHIRTGIAEAGYFAGRWLPGAGWRARFNHVIARKAERTCDIELVSGPVTLLGRDVLGGCDLHQGKGLIALAKVSAVATPKIELQEVRFILEED